MNTPSQTPNADSADRFTGLAATYARCRPTYPAAAVDFVLGRCGLAPGAVLVDVGCGTGISARLFAERGLTVVGVEPNAEMRASAEVAPCAAAVAPVYRDGRAEATGVGDAAADAVLAAQAFHWFAAPAALAEFRRVLRPGGWVVLLWNERDPADPFTAAYGAAFARFPETAAVEGPRATAGEVLLHSDLFVERELHTFPNGQELDEAGVLGRAFSTSYAPRDPARAAELADALRAAVRRYTTEGRVVLHYRTSVYLGRRP